MNTELQSKLLEIVTSMQDGFLKTKDFAMEQLPSVANEYILFNRMYMSFLMLSILGVAVTWGMFYKKTVIDSQKVKKSPYYDTRPDNFDTFKVVTMVLTVLLSFMFLLNLREFFLVWFAPKIFLIESIAHMVK
jgi:hypothetical protein